VAWWKVLAEDNCLARGRRKKLHASGAGGRRRRRPHLRGHARHRFGHDRTVRIERRSTRFRAGGAVRFVVVRTFRIGCASSRSSGGDLTPAQDCGADAYADHHEQQRVPRMKRVDAHAAEPFGRGQREDLRNGNDKKRGYRT
jgi:hypothetical protein